MRSLYDAIVTGVSYNALMVHPSAIELIAPIVDSGTSTFNDDDSTNGKFRILVRQVCNTDAVSVLVVYLSNQQYRIPALDERGAISFASLQMVDDMRATDVDKTVHYIGSLGYPFQKFRFRAMQMLNITEEGLANLQLIPPPGHTQVAKTIQTACSEGFYIKGESEQSNINHFQRYIEPLAVNAVSRWRWYSRPVWKDSWAWIRGVRFFIGLELLSSLVILCLATYRSYRSGKKWIGDAFVSISSSNVLHGVAVLASWRVNEFWALHEFAQSVDVDVSGWSSTRTFIVPMRADVLTMYLSVCGVIGRVLREKMDPFLAVISFLLGFEYRIPILQNFSPALRDHIIEYSEYSSMLNMSPRVPGQDKISPMGDSGPRTASRSATTSSRCSADYQYFYRCYRS